MRLLLTVQMETEKANAAISENTLPEVITTALGRVKPEAVYFGANDGMRTGFIVLDLQEPADLPSVCEPFFQKLGAKISITPVMNLEDIQAGLRKFAEN
jgi:hypothetical protein